MDKLKLAHDWYLKQLEVHDNASVHGAWQYADAMQAEAEKREDRTRPAVLNMADSPQLEWQPDWSQSPEWANYWIKTSGKMFAWLERKPSISNLTGGWNIECMKKQIAPSFGFTGSHIVERPDGF